MIQTQVKINHYDFENSLFEDFSTNHFAKDLWPLVYILSDGDTKRAYVGETTRHTCRQFYLNNPSVSFIPAM